MQRRKAVIARTSVLDMREGLNPRIAGGGQARSTLFVSIIPRTHHQHTPFDATLFLGSSKAPCHIYTFSMFSNWLVTVQGSAKRWGLGCVNSLPGSAWL